MTTVSTASDRVSLRDTDDAHGERSPSMLTSLDGGVDLDVHTGGS